MSRYCETCHRTLDEGSFYSTKNLSKYPDGRLNQCKKCITMFVDNSKPETFEWILKEVDVPFVKKEWENILDEVRRTTPPSQIVTGMAVLGKYLSKMRLSQWKSYTYADSEKANEELESQVANAMRKQGYTEEEISEELKEKERAEQEKKEKENPPPQREEDPFESYLTEEDKTMLRLKWGSEYTPEQWVRMEQLYNDFFNSYDIQTAGHKDTLLMVCKASLKANELMNIGDVEGAQKMIKVYDALMKSGNFQAVQNKEVQGEGIDSVGEIVRLAEKEGFIPRYYVDSPKDSVDKVIKDLQHYTKTLVTEELNLGSMIEAAVAANERDKNREEKINIDDSEDEVIVDDYGNEEEEDE